MGDNLLPPTTLRNLSDKLYEKRKAAALEVEQVSAADTLRRLTILGRCTFQFFALFLRFGRHRPRRMSQM